MSPEDEYDPKTDPLLFPHRITRANRMANKTYNLSWRVNCRVTTLARRLKTLEDEALLHEDYDHLMTHAVTEKCITDIWTVLRAMLEQMKLPYPPEEPPPLEDEDCSHQYFPRGTICLWCGEDRKVDDTIEMTINIKKPDWPECVDCPNPSPEYDCPPCDVWQAHQDNLSDYCVPPYPGYPDVKFAPGRVEGVAGWTGGLAPSKEVVVPKSETSPEAIILREALVVLQGIHYHSTIGEVVSREVIAREKINLALAVIERRKVPEPEMCPVCGNEIWVRGNISWCTHCNPSHIVHRGPDPNARYVYPDGTYKDPHTGEVRIFVVEEPEDEVKECPGVECLEPERPPKEFICPNHGRFEGFTYCPACTNIQMGGLNPVCERCGKVGAEVVMDHHDSQGAEVAEYICGLYCPDCAMGMSMDGYSPQDPPPVTSWACTVCGNTVSIHRGSTYCVHCGDTPCKVRRVLPPSPPKEEA